MRVAVTVVAIFMYQTKIPFLFTIWILKYQMKQDLVLISIVAIYLYQSYQPIKHFHA